MFASVGAGGSRRRLRARGCIVEHGIVQCRLVEEVDNIHLHPLLQDGVWYFQVSDENVNVHRGYVIDAVASADGVKRSEPPQGLGRAAHMKPTSHGPRPGPAHPIFNILGPVRPIPLSKFLTWRGPAHDKFQIGPAWPGPARSVISRDIPCKL